MSNFLPSRTQRRRGNGSAALGTSTPGKPRDKRALYHCNYCTKDISNSIRIKCAVCPDFDLCLQCFSVGVEIRPHKCDHAYRIVDNLSFPLFEPTWGADEELLLLEAVDMFGPGNWAAICEHVGTKSLEECKRHYLSVYIEHDNFPLPQPSQEMIAYEAVGERDAFGRQAVIKTPQKAQMERLVGMDSAVRQALLFGLGEAEGGAVEKGTAADGGAAVGPSDTATPVASPVEAEAGVSGVADGFKSKTLAPKIIAGDADARHLANAEKAKLHGKRVDTNQASTSAREITPAAVKPPPHCTNAKALAPHAKPPLHQLKKSSSAGDFGGKTDLTIGDNTVEVTGFHRKRDEFEPEYDQDAELMVSELEFLKSDPEEERKLKLRLLDIYNMRLDERDRRKVFIRERGLLNVKAQQAAEKKMGPVERMLHSQLRVFARYHSAAEHEKMVEGMAVEHHLRTRIAELKECRRAGVRRLADFEAFEQEKRRRLGAKETAMAVRVGGAALSFRREDSNGGVSSAAGKDSAKPGVSHSDSRSAMAALLNWRTQRGVALDISYLPGVDQLGQQERHLCATARITPPHYLAIKERLIRASQQNGSVTRIEARNMLKMDPMKASRVYELLLNCGWINSRPEGGSA